MERDWSAGDKPAVVAPAYCTWVPRIAHDAPPLVETRNPPPDPWFPTQAYSVFDSATDQARVAQSRQEAPSTPVFATSQVEPPVAVVKNPWLSPPMARVLGPAGAVRAVYRDWT